MATIGRALVLLSALALAGCPQRNTPRVIWVGHVAPLSGPDRASGEHARQAILLAVEEANRDGQRVHGRRVAVVHADDRGDAEAAHAEAVRLITVNKVAALLGGIDPAEAERIVRAGQPYGLPVVTLSALPTPTGNDDAVALVPAPAYRGRILGQFVVQELKPARVVVIADGRSPLFTDLAIAFAREFPRDKVEEWTYQQEAELSDLAKRLSRAGPQAVLIVAPPRDFLRLSTLVREGGLKTAWLYGGPEGGLPLLQADREAGRGTFLAVTYLADVATPANQEFVKKYRDRYQEPPETAAALAYDGARLLFDVMRRVRTLDAAEVRRELGRTEKFDSLTGPLSFGKDLHAVRTLYVARLEDGQVKLVKPYEPEKK
ncbi:MAG TPA: ABC transporter substrate-binding protein [Gemmataceae bacterium]|nr:ABC transporter substrate-binding protein [Gemmataceae bacterium]